jgi:ribosomal protein S1
VKIYQKVVATVREVDAKRKRISLSLSKKPQQGKQEKQPKQQKQADYQSCGRYS